MLVVLIVGVLISAASVTYVWYVASEEPFFLSTATLVTLESLGLILIVLLGIWARATLAAVPLRASKLRVPLSVLALSWTLVCSVYLVTAMAGCWHDYQRFRGGQSGTLGSVEASPSTR